MANSKPAAAAAAAPAPVAPAPVAPAPTAAQAAAALAFAYGTPAAPHGVAAKFMAHARPPAPATGTTVAAALGMRAGTTAVYPWEKYTRALYYTALGLGGQPVANVGKYLNALGANPNPAHLAKCQALATTVATALRAGQVVANPGSLAGGANPGGLVLVGNSVRIVAPGG